MRIENRVLPGIQNLLNVAQVGEKRIKQLIIIVISLAIIDFNKSCELIIIMVRT